MATKKLDIEELQSILINGGVADPAIRRKVIEEAQKVLEENEQEKDEKAPKGKYKHTIMIRSDDPQIKQVLENQEGFIMKSLESVDDNDLMKLMKSSAIEQNRNVKKKGKVGGPADWFRYIKIKFRKSLGIQNVTKNPVRIIVMDKAEFDFTTE